MSVAQTFEGFEVETQNDPARAGLFNTELGLIETEPDLGVVFLRRFTADAIRNTIEIGDPSELGYINDFSLDEQDALAFILDTEAITKTFEGVAISEKRQLMLSAILLKNGEKFRARDITCLFGGSEDSSRHQFLTLVKALRNSRFNTLLSVSLKDAVTMYSFGKKWYDEEYKFSLQNELQECIDDFHIKEIQKLELNNSLKRDQLTSSTAKDQAEELLLPQSQPDHKWEEKAACLQIGSEAFFPEDGGSNKQAKKVCLGCEVREECLNKALRNDERFGVWGGLGENERRKLKRRKS